MHTKSDRNGFPIHHGLRDILALIAISMIGLPLFAGGSADDFAFEPVSGESHWTYTVNLEELKEGKHNLVIRSVDSAGNVRLEGPYDFRVDPETDIPSVAVAHPQPGDRAGRMLPIIGTARDDDGISRVEVSVNDGSWRPASGNEAWSAVLDTGALGDGPHALSVRSFDLNGIESPHLTVPFVVDTSAPAGGVSDPVSGARISGKTSIAGFLQDENGITVLELSRDGGETWENLKFSRDKESGTASFDLNLDSRKLEDGPVVWWFRGIDSQQSTAEIPFLFFVDNLGPEIVLELPSRGDTSDTRATEGRSNRGSKDFEPVPGNVFLAGTVSDNSGIESLRIIVGKDDPIELPLTPGNPWFTWPLDLSGRRDKQVELRIVAVDTAGNLSEEKFRIPIDSEADKPQIALDNIEIDNGKAVLENGFPESAAFLTGTFFDDDGAGSLHWQSGDLEGTLEPVERAWRLDLPGLPTGDIDLVLTPRDRFGLSGESLELSFPIAPPPPSISIEKIAMSGDDAVVDWMPGIRIPYNGAVITGSVNSAAGKSLTLMYTEGEQEAKSLSLKTVPEDPERRTFQIPVKKGSTSGVHNFIVHARDGFGNESVLGSAFYMETEPAEDGTVSDPRIGDQTVNIPLPQLRESDAAAVLRFGQPLQGWTSGAPAAGAVLEPESSLLRLRTSGNAFFIEALKAGLSEPLRIVLVDGSESEPIIVLTDEEGPKWEMDSPGAGAWSNGKLVISGTIVDAAGVASAEWSAGGASYKPFEIEEKGSGRFVFSFEAELDTRTDGPLIISLRAEDTAGNSSTYDLPVVLDTTEPLMVMLLPPAGYSVGAQNTLVYQIPGDELLDEVAVSLDGETWMPADESSLFAMNLNLAGFDELPDSLKVRAIDRAGNLSEQVPQLAFDPLSDKPQTFIQTPVDGSVVRGPADIAGLVADGDAIAEIKWRIDGGTWRTLSGDSSFRIPLPLDDLEDGSHLLEAYAEDAAGNVGEIDTSSFQVTRREAELQMSNPEIGVAVRRRTVVSGTARDENGISEVWISFDNGNSYFRAEGETDFNPEAADPAEPETDRADAAAAPGQAENGEAEWVEGGQTLEDTDAQTWPKVFDDPVNWQYSMDTSILEDGVHTLLIKVVDGAGDEALLAGLLEVDNQSPLLALGNPLEGSLQTGAMTLEGRVVDDSGVTGFSVSIERAGEVLLEYNELTDGVFHIPFSFEGLTAGEVLLRVQASDRAGNTTAVSRSFEIEPGRRVVTGDISLPVEGASVGPSFVLAGTVQNAVAGDTASLFIGDRASGELELDSKGRFYREFKPGELQSGDHQFRVDVETAEGEIINGTVRSFSASDTGPWVILDGYPPGSSIGERPLLSGRAGYFLAEPAVDDKDAIKAYQKRLKQNKPDRVEISLNEGLSFEKAKGTEHWEYRIETGNMVDGDLGVLVRARYSDGWVYARTLLHLDKTPPDLKLNETIADGRFNGSLEISGSSSDDEELESVAVSVRDGSQTLYEVPSFIQGLYFNTSVFGATWVDAGLGVTFFDDNVKLELHAGWAPDEVYDRESDSMVAARVSGVAIGAKLLANVVYLPLGYFFGPNWERLSVSFAIGANFSYFSRFGTEGGGMMSSVAAQMEIPKIDFPDRKFITYMAPYLEGQLWFFSSDVSTTPFFTASLGLRLGLL